MIGNLFTAFVTGFAASTALIIPIGAQNLFVLQQGLRRQHVGPVVLFCGSADTLLIILGVAGVGALVTHLPQLALSFALGGGAFLTVYGSIALRRFLRPGPAIRSDARPATLGKTLLTTAAFTFLNPHVYLDTVLLLGTIGSAQAAPLRPLFAAGAASASLLWFPALGFGAQLAAPIFTRPVAWRALDLLVGLTMLALAGLLVTRAIATA